MSGSPETRFTTTSTVPTGGSLSLTPKVARPFSGTARVVGAARIRGGAGQISMPLNCAVSRVATP